MGINTFKCLLIVMFAVLCAPVLQADDKVTCGCHIKDDKTSCAVDLAAEAEAQCVCVKETMYGKRKFKAEACVVGDPSPQ
ncbi:MAG: hypothetical protein O3A65_06255 [Proteobacteria bacterium]|nr:hypothetical protein [Pseudomonadota bacterium]